MSKKWGKSRTKKRKGGGMSEGDGQGGGYTTPDGDGGQNPVFHPQKDDALGVQAVHAMKSHHKTYEDAVKRVKDMGYKEDGYREHEDRHAFSQFPAHRLEDGTHREVEIAEGVRAIVGKMRGKEDEDDDEMTKAAGWLVKALPAKFKAKWKDCVSDKIPKLIDEGYPRDQAAAIAYSMCGEKDATAETPSSGDIVDTVSEDEDEETKEDAPGREVPDGSNPIGLTHEDEDEESADMTDEDTEVKEDEDEDMLGKEDEDEDMLGKDDEDEDVMAKEDEDEDMVKFLGVVRWLTRRAKQHLSAIYACGCTKKARGIAQAIIRSGNRYIKQAPEMVTQAASMEQDERAAAPAGTGGPDTGTLVDAVTALAGAVAMLFAATQQGASAPAGGSPSAPPVSQVDMDETPEEEDADETADEMQDEEDASEDSDDDDDPLARYRGVKVDGKWLDLDAISAALDKAEERVDGIGKAWYGLTGREN